MSNEVDKRIIEMEFKNDQFEREASKTLSTLEALKQKLNNNFSTKGAEELNQAIKTVDVSPITKGLETVQVQFNALQIAGKRVIENIVDAAMDAVHKITSKLTGVVNQIKVGGATRAQNIENAKFMLSGLGIEWTDIVEDINYGVQDTAYGLDAAAKVASQLVASNVTLGKEMQSSLRAVSGVAAMTNSTYEEIGHIFTSIAGQGKLMTMQLQQFSLRGLNVAADLAKAMGTTEAAIREMVTKGQIDFQTFANAMDELYGEHAKEANKTFSGALSNTKAALSRLGADIQAQKFETLRTVLLEVTAKLKELKKAIAPVEESINNMIAAVGKLVESFIKSVDIKGIVDKIAPKVQSFCSLVSRVADAWREIREEEKKLNAIVYDNGYTAYQKARAELYRDTTDEIAEAVDKLAQVSEGDLARYSKQAWDIWNYGTYGNGQDRVDALGKDYELTQAYVEKMLELGWSQEKMDEYIAAQRKKRDEAAAKKKRVDSIKTTVKNVLAIFDNLKIVMHNIFSSIVNVVSAAFGGLSESFTNVGLLGAVVNMTAKLAEFSNKIAITKEKADKIRPVAKAIGDILKTIAKGIYNCVKFLVNFISAAAKNEIVIAIFTAIKKAILAIFDGLKKLYTKLKESGAWDKFVDILKIVAKWIGERIVDGINTLGDVVVNIGGLMVSVFEKIRDKIKSIADSSEEGKNWFVTIKEFFEGGIDISKTWLQKIGDKLSNLFGAGGETAESIFQLAYDKAAAFGRGLIEGINSITWEDLKKAGGIVASIATFLAALQFLGSLSTLNFGIGSFFKRLGKFFSSLTSISRAYANRTVAAAVEALGRTLLMIAISIVALAWTIATVPGGEQTVDKAVVLVTSFVAILGLYEIIIGAIKRKWSATSVNRVNLMLNARKIAIVTILGSIALFSYSVTTLLKNVVNGLEGDDPEGYSASLKAAMSIFAAILIMLITSVYAFMKMAKDMNGIVANDALEKMAKLMNVIGKSITKLSFTIILLTAVFSLLPDTAKSNIKYALMMMGGVLVILVLVCGILAEVGSKMTEGDVNRIEIITKLIDKVTKSITKLALIFIALTVVVALSSATTFGLTVGVLVGIVAALAGLIYMLAKLKINPGEFNLKMMALQKVANMFTLILLAFAGLALSLGKMNEMGVSPQDFILIVAVMGAIITIVTYVGGMMGKLPGIARGLEAFGVAMLGLGVAFAGIGGGVLMLVYAMFILEKFIEKIDDFYATIQEKKDIFIGAVGELVGMVAAGLFVGLIQALNNLINNMEPIVEALLDTVIALFNTLGTALYNRREELGEATMVLVQGVVAVIIEVLAGALAGLWNECQELAAKLEKEMEDFWGGTEDYYETGQSRDAMAEAYVQRLNANESAGYTEEQKKAWRKWLELNGYDENGKRTESWTLETEYDIDYAYTIANKTTADEINERYAPGSKARDYVAFTGDASKATEKAKEEAKDAAENTSDIKDSLTSMADDAKQGLDITKYMNMNMTASGEEVTEGANNLFNALGMTGNDMFNTESFENASNVIDSAAEETATNYEEYESAVNEKTNILAQAVENMGERIKNVFKTLGEDSQQFGIDIIEGLIKGMSDRAEVLKLEDATKEACRVVTETVIKLFDINSPSKVMQELGGYAMLGFVRGLVDERREVMAATEAAGEAAIMSMRQTIQYLSSEVFSDMEQPTIRPVLDLDGIREGKYSMQELLDMRREYGIAMLTSSEAQQASKAKVRQWLHIGSNFSDENTVNAINDLNSEVSTLKDAINGMQVTIDGRALVGQIVTPMDKALGRKAMAGRRGV